jgi:predicted ATP-grasp superfamily ATP-dependent carboligase
VRALIVEDGFQRGALAACRALAAAGWIVGTASPARGLAAYSRCVKAWHDVPAPGDPGDAFAAAVEDAIASGGYDVVFAAGDGELLGLTARRADLSATVAHPAHETVRRALDKIELAEAGARAGLRSPETLAADRRLARATGPFVVKPRLTMARSPSGAYARLRAVVAQTGAEATAHAGRLRDAGGEPIVQRLVPGRLDALIALTDADGRVVARAQQEAELVWPPGNGSIRARSVAVDESLAAKATALLAGLECTGLAQVQFVVPDDGEPLLIDLNPRFYGSLALALAAGPNLAAIWAGLATGGPMPPGGDARPGVRYHWLEADLRRLANEQHSRLPGSFAETLAYARGASHGVWRRDDPGPALAHALQLGGRALRKLGRAFERH